MNDILQVYCDIKAEIEKRLEEFKVIGLNASDNELFKELCFCLLTPQSKAKTCWKAIERLNNLIYTENEDIIVNKIYDVRFKNNKAKYLVLARKTLTNNGKIEIKNILESFTDVSDKREWLVKNIKGYGYKEASHFLRNIGLGNDIAILDRHILKNLIKMDVIQEIPKSISKNKYLEIENKMKNFSDYINIPMHHLDLLFWYRETGEVFK